MTRMVIPVVVRERRSHLIEAGAVEKSLGRRDDRSLVTEGSTDGGSEEDWRMNQMRMSRKQSLLMCREDL